MLRLPDHRVWDSWVPDDGIDYHLYFLMAPRALKDASKRHLAARVGHAVSRDLVEWEFRGECFGPSEAGFDGLAIWTGSVVRDHHRWRMFYTALSLPELDLFAAPIVRLRDGSAAIIGFRNLEAKNDSENLGFEIIDPIPVTLDDEGCLVAS